MVQFAIRNSSFVILVLLLLSWGCHRKSVAVAPPSPVTPAPAESAPSVGTSRVPAPPKPVSPKPAPLPKTAPAPRNLDAANRNFQAGNYRQAVRDYDAFLKANPKSRNRDEALFHLGLSWALPNDSSRDLRRAQAAFKQLIAEFPTSRYRKQAEFILALQAQIERLRLDVSERDDKIKLLSEELQKLKDIDLQRRPSRPPE
jgi:TolA-binding protein